VFIESADWTDLINHATKFKLGPEALRHWNALHNILAPLALGDECRGAELWLGELENGCYSHRDPVAVEIVVHFLRHHKKQGILFLRR